MVPEFTRGDVRKSAKSLQMCPWGRSSRLFTHEVVDLQLDSSIVSCFSFRRSLDFPVLSTWCCRGGLTGQEMNHSSAKNMLSLEKLLTHVESAIYLDDHIAFCLFII